MKRTRNQSIVRVALGASFIAGACSLQVPSEEELFGDNDTGGSSGTGNTSGSAGDGGTSAGPGDGGDPSTGGADPGEAGSAGTSGGSGGAAGSGGDAGMGGATPPFDPDDGIVLHYPFDETSGLVARDRFNTGQNGTVVSLTGESTVNWVVSGRIGGALQLSGKAEDGQHVVLPRNVLSNLDETTIAVWFRWDGGAPQQRVFDLGYDPPSWVYFAPATPGVPRAAVHEPSGTFFDAVVGSPISVATWTHVAVSWSETQFAVYVDGELGVSRQPLGTDTLGMNGRVIIPRNLGSTLNNWIGRSQFVADPFFTGLVDDFRIYDRALSAANVAELYASFE